MTVRQTCLLTVVSITLLHVRTGRPVSFGEKYWMLWAPTVLLVITSTSIAGVIAGAGLQSLFVGIIGYTSFIAILSSVAFVCLIWTLVTIKRNLAALGEEFDPWPPAKMAEEKSRPSFSTEDVDAIREGASWITSNASSSRDSISAWSFSTHQTSAVPSHHGYGSDRLQKAFATAKSSCSFGAHSSRVNDVPLVPPSPYGLVSSAAHNFSDPDPFRREAPPRILEQPRVRLDSQTSWLTSTDGSHTTMSAWSYPTSVKGDSIHNASSLDLRTMTPVSSGSHPEKPRLASAQVLGGYGFVRGVHEVEKGLAAFAAPLGNIIDISTFRLFGWLLYVWAPLARISVAFILSVTISSPILAINVLSRSPIPIPSGLFDVHEPDTRVKQRALPVVSTDAPFRYSKEYKRSTSTSPTVVEGRRSGDVWITNGNAVEGKGKMGRVMGLLPPIPKLSVLPEVEDDHFCTQPLPIRKEDSDFPVNLHNRSYSETSARFERHRKDSIVSSRLSEARDSLAYAGKIMIAQRHYSALAQTIVVTCPSEKDQSAKADNVIGSATGAKSTNESVHLRSRSVSFINGPKNSTNELTPSPPPTIPLPPTPPRMRTTRFACHTKSHSSGYSFGPVDDMNEIDSLTAGVLPILVPGINLDGMKVTEGDYSPLGTFSDNKRRKAAKKLEEFRGDLSSPEVHSTPVTHRARDQRSRKTFGHKRNRYSLPRYPSFGIGKDDAHSSSRSSAENQRALKTKNDRCYTTTIATEAPFKRAGELDRAKSTRSLGLRADVPHGLDTPRDSLSSMAPPFSAASTVTLFEEFIAGLAEDPEAQSTPHNIHVNNPTSKCPGHPFSLSEEKPPSSVLHLRSDDHPVPTTPNAETTMASPMLALAQWSTRAVRHFIPKVIDFGKRSNADTPQSDSKPGSPGGNLRPLALLQYRDNNIPVSPVLNPVHPLALGKRQKAQGTAVMQNENAKPDSASSRVKNLKPLKLVQFDTTNIRGTLRKD
ncbi:hypothetical protein C0993_007996 [Termitomyces sp. T159_Od127]|nr:hypothetical protein C0993_007996 [Termitomyces sp. T159_Od127]